MSTQELEAYAQVDTLSGNAEVDWVSKISWWKNTFSELPTQ
jgi:hypothetical protein